MHAQGTDVDVVEVLTGLYGFRVRDARESDGVLVIEAELAAGEAACPECGVFSASLKQGPGRPQRLRDAPSFGRRVTVWWWKRRFRCLTSGCSKRSFVERSPLVAPRARTTERLRDLAWRWVRTRPVSEVASEVGVSWQTVWRWTAPRIEAALEGREVPTCLGLDETSFRRPQRFATGLVDLDTGRLHDLLEGRSGRKVASWLTEHGAADRVREVAMDPYSGFLRAVRDRTEATVVLDHFHVIRLANQALTDLRCRRQQELCGHRGRKHDPLWAARRDLLRGAERLTPGQAGRIRRAFQADPYDELECAWVLKETIRDIYQAPNRKQAEGQLTEWYQLVETYDLPEFHKLAGTLRRWQPQLLAYFDGHLSNGRTEGRNLVIKQVKRTGYGYRNFNNYRLRVLHRCA